MVGAFLFENFIPKSRQRSPKASGLHIYAVLVRDGVQHVATDGG